MSHMGELVSLEEQDRNGDSCHVNDARNIGEAVELPVTSPPLLTRSALVGCVVLGFESLFSTPLDSLDVPLYFCPRQSIRACKERDS